MFPAIVVPDMPVPAFDTRPIAALVYQQPADGVASRLRDIARTADVAVTAHRGLVKIKMHAQLSHIAEAEQSGWYVNLADLRTAIKHRHEEDGKAIADLMTSVNKFIRDAHRIKVPGSNTLHASGIKINACLNAWLGDLDDYLSEVDEVRGRMNHSSSSAPMVRAASAYQDAIKSVLGVESAPEVLMDLAQGGLIMWFSVPLADEVRFDRNSRRSVERRIHAFVEKVDESLVGRVAIKYETPALSFDRPALA